MQTTRVFVVLTLLMASACSPSQQQQTPPPAAPPAPTTAATPATGTATAAAAPSSEASTPKGLFPGVGSHHHPIATTRPEAQVFFDQGMALVFGFNHEEAVRSFQRAAELDPKAPMPHWGIAWALGPNYNLDIDDPRAQQAFAAVQIAKTLAANGPDVERAYVKAMASRYSQDMKADRTKLARRYADATRDLMKAYPDDLDAATLYAESLMNLRPWKLWDLQGKPAPDTLEILAVLEGVMARDPGHLGANHYYIHSIEASPNPARAWPSAVRLSTLAPAAGHLTHMPAHILARTGDQAGAARSNLAGAEADREYLKTAPPDGFYGMAYYPHNLHFLADSEMMRGRYADARKAAEQVVGLLAPHADMMPMIESMMTMQTAVLLRFGRHDEILALTEPPANRPVMRAWYHFSRGVALARTGKALEANEERGALTRSITQVPDSALFGGTGLESAKHILGLAATVLDARIAWAEGKKAASIAAWKKAVAESDRVAYDEPPVWFYPIRESLGAALLLDNQAAEAERIFRDDLVKHARNARSLFGLHESLMKQGKSADAAWVQQQFADAWKDADVPRLTLDAL